MEIYEINKILDENYNRMLKIKEYLWHRRIKKKNKRDKRKFKKTRGVVRSGKSKETGERIKYAWIENRALWRIRGDVWGNIRHFGTL